MLDSFSDSPPCSLDWIGKAFEALQDLDSSCFEIQLALQLTEQSPPSFFAHFNDQKAINNTKTYQNLISILAKVLNVPIGLKGVNYYSEAFEKS